MVRTARAVSENGIYHVMLRGIDQIQLFYDDDDRTAFLERLAHYKEKTGFSLYAYALMGNHVHLLIKEGHDGLSMAMKSLATSFAHYYNAKYDRKGYVFQNRFKSEPVQTDEYFLACLRYILNNPVAIGESISYGTSFSECIDAGKTQETLVDAAFVLEMFSDQAKRATELFIEFVSTRDDEKHQFLDENVSRHIKDKDAIETIMNVAKVKYCSDLASSNKETRNQILATLKEKGLSVRQISRLTGINRSIVLDAGKPKRAKNHARTSALPSEKQNVSFER